MLRGKKAQVTYYIIAGVILLFIVAFVIYLMSRPAKDILREIPSVSVLSSEKKPIADLITSCIAEVSEDGLRRLGDKGGYINSSGLNYNPLDPTEANAVQLSGDLIVPYWHYLESPNDCTNCVFNSKKPELFKSRGKNSIEEQLNNFIDNNLKDCINFDTLKSQGYKITEKSPPKTDTIISRDAVAFKVELPLEFEINGIKYSVGECPECFLYKSDLNLFEIYDFATKLSDWVAQQNSLEILNKRAISYYSGLNKNIPPSELEFGSAAPKYWLKSNVKEEITSLLTQFIPMMQVGGTANYHYITAPENTDQELYEQLFNRDFYIPLNTTHSDLEASFSYLSWKPYFDMNCKGELCKPDSINNNFIFNFGINRYSFSYDLSYPALVRIKAPSAFNAKGYNFQFFLESNMRKNNPLKSNVALTQNYVSRETNFCDPIKYTSGNISIKIKDKLNSAPINAEINYLCGNDNCMIGSTINGSLNSKFPRCTGGILSISKNNYQTLQTNLDIVNDKQTSINLELQPIIKINTTIKKWMLEPGTRSISKKGADVEWTLNTNKNFAPNNEEYIIISLNKKKENTLDTDFSTVLDFKPGETSKEISLVPGTYTVKITAFIKPSQQLKIPPHERSIEYRTWYGKKKEEKYKIPTEEIIFNNEKGYLSGNAEYIWKTPKLDRNKKIEFSYFGFDLSNIDENNRVIEDLNTVNLFSEYSKTHEYLTSPILK